MPKFRTQGGLENRPRTGAGEKGCRGRPIWRSWEERLFFIIVIRVAMALLRSKKTPPPAPRRSTAFPATPPAKPQRHLTGVLQRLSRALGFTRSAGPAPAVGLPPLRDLCRTAVEHRGQVKGLIAIAQVADAYSTLTSGQREAFFEMLVRDFAADEAAVAQAVNAYQSAGTGKQQALMALTDALESPRLVLFRQFNTIPHGIKFLLDLQAEVLSRLPRQPSMAPVEHDLRHLLSSWFNYGFLDLISIGWDTPSAFLEKLIQNEAVHQISSWEDLKRRLMADRRCFAFIHPSMPEEPLIFVEVALVRGVATSIQALLDLDAPSLPPHQADTAVFYSISNAQPGLRGINLGNLLIKQAVAQLRQEFPHLRRFVTLSPIPWLRKDWLDPKIADGSLAAYFTSLERAQLQKLTGTGDAAEALRAVVSSGALLAREAVGAAAKRGLLRAARDYLTTPDKYGRTPCPVGNFHFSNGALLERIHWLGDTSGRGIRQSAGMMVNYLYDMKRFEAHQAAYLDKGRIAHSRAVRRL